MKSRATRKAEGRMKAQVEHAKQRSVEKAFREQLGWNWRRVEKEMRARALKFTDQDMAKLVRAMRVVPPT